MKNPYDVLGISPDASDEDIKKAYRRLSRKYHPDANVDNPNKEQAEEKFKEVQSAYQTIMNQKSSDTGKEYRSGFTGSGGFGSFAGYGAYGSRETADDEDALYINAAYRYAANGLYREAMNTLRQVKIKNARYYYVKAVASAGLGDQTAALEAVRIAVNMDPGNPEYRQFLQYLQRGGQWYTARGMGYGNPVGGGSNFCLRLCIANMLCNLCCGGGGLCCGGGPRYM